MYLTVTLVCLSLTNLEAYYMQLVQTYTDTISDSLDTNPCFCRYESGQKIWKLNHANEKHWSVGLNLNPDF